MRRTIFLIASLATSLLLTSCGGKSASVTKNLDFRMAISKAASIECTDAVISKAVNCSFPIEITSIANSPKTLTGNFYALVGGRIFLADDTIPAETKSISDDWNPGDSKSAVVAFNVPKNSRITSVFLGPSNLSSVSSAILAVPLSVTAIDGWTPELETKVLRYQPKVNDLVKRLRSASPYPWKVSGYVNSANMLTNLEFDIEEAMKSPTRNKLLNLPICLVEVLRGTTGLRFTEKSFFDIEMRYQDEKTGLGLILSTSAPDMAQNSTGNPEFPTLGAQDKYCGSIITAASGIKELK